MSIAIADAQAFAVMTDSGVDPDRARALLARMKPAAHFDARPYYAPARVYRAIKREKGRP